MPSRGLDAVRVRLTFRRMAMAVAYVRVSMAAMRSGSVFSLARRGGNVARGRASIMGKAGISRSNFACGSFSKTATRNFKAAIIPNGCSGCALIGFYFIGFYITYGLIVLILANAF